MPLTAGPTNGHHLLRVLEVHRPPAPSVRYVDQVVDGDPPGIEFRFGGIRALSHDVDVVHLHRLNPLLGSRGSGPKRVATVMAVALLLKRHRIALVRTVHGPAPTGVFARLSTWILDRATTSFVVLDDTTGVPRSRPVTLIPHGHYRERFIGYPQAPRVLGRALCIGPSRPGSDLEGPIQDITTQNPELRLRIVGEESSALSGLTENAVATYPELEHVGRVSDGSLVKELGAAELVVLARVTELEDLSLLLLALSLDRPVLIPDDAATADLDAAIGAGWIHRYADPLTTGSIDATMRALREDPPVGRPNLDGRDPATTSARYAAVFQDAARKLVRRDGRRRA